jgi:hypothetical protein
LPANAAHPVEQFRLVAGGVGHNDVSVRFRYLTPLGYILTPGTSRQKVHDDRTASAPERVVQILGLIDYLLYVAHTGVPAERNEAP